MVSETVLYRWLGRVVAVRPGEVRALVWSFAYFFCLLAGYYVLRPLRGIGRLIMVAGPGCAAGLRCDMAINGLAASSFNARRRAGRYERCGVRWLRAVMA